MPVTSYKNLTIHYHDEDEYKTLIEEIFKKHTYYVEFETDTPLIIDCGAHIGLTALYWFSQYPKARLICIEPNPQNLFYLQKNLTENGVENVEIVPKALVGSREKRTKLSLYTNFKWTVFSSLQQGGWTGEEKGEAVEVETVKLSSLITNPVDLLKIDIEGMETEVIEETQSRLSLVSHVACEFHKTPTHNEDKVLSILKKSFSSVDVSKDERKERNKRNQLLFIEAQ